LNDATARLNQAIRLLDEIAACPPTSTPIDDTLGVLCEIKRGTFPTLKTPPGDFPFIVLAAGKRTANNFQFDGEAVCIPLVSSTGHGHAAIHRIHYAQGQFAVANILAAAIVKPGIRLSTKYLYYYLWRFKEEKLVKLMAGTANTSLTVEKLNEVRVRAPHEALQSEIVTAIDSAFEELATVRQLLSSTFDVLEDATVDILQAVFPK
jgi:type I restriction enzyme S subunit